MKRHYLKTAIPGQFRGCGAPVRITEGLDEYGRRTSTAACTGCDWSETRIRPVYHGSPESCGGELMVFTGEGRVYQLCLGCGAEGGYRVDDAAVA